MTYAEALDEFIKKHCAGQDYDSCHNSPCRYASASGCQHPQHPKKRDGGDEKQ